MPAKGRGGLVGESEPQLPKEGIHTEGMRNWHQRLELEQGKRCPRAEWEPKKHKKNVFKECLPGAGGRAQAGTGDWPCRERPWLECRKPSRGEKGDTVRDARAPGRGVGSLCKGEIGSVRAQVK